MCGSLVISRVKEQCKHLLITYYLAMELNLERDGDDQEHTSFEL